MTQLPETIGNVREVDITNEMQIAYLDYAMSVIVSRALPDVRDGLKPVHRRILYAMHDMGLTGEKAYKKSARIVGEVLGKYHPHGDTAVYDAMVRMAQDFSLRYPLVDGQGNFGSVDGDNAAAMRYTEARLARISDLVLADLDKETVEWTDNFDNTLKEPQVLPSTLPNLLINGASGIAVGMSTNVPPHNLGEIVDALVYVLDNFTRVDDISVEELLKFVKGPDFPTGGIVFRYREDRRGLETTDVITQGYATGRARLIVQAKAHFEEMSRGRTRIIVTELPYQTNKTNLLERIAFLVRDGKIDGITDMRDESDRAGMRIVIELTRNADAKVVLSDLFKYTPMQQTFGISMLALVDGEPRTLSLKRMLQLFIEHRQEVIRRRSEFDLARARERAHIVEGLLRALDILDEVIETIRRSQRVETARANLMRNFDFSEVQAQAILDMPLKRLAALERKRLQDEYDELLARIAYLEDLLANPTKILAVIRTELLQIREQYADARRTQIVDRIKGTLTATDLLPDQKVLISVGVNGDVRRQALADINKTNLRQNARDSAVALLTANTQDFLYVFDKKGGCNRVPIHELPQDETKHLADLTNYSRRDRIVAAVALPRLTVEDAAGYLFLVTRGGAVKRVMLADFVAAASSNPEVIRIDEKDELGWVFPTPGGHEVILVAAGGRSIRFGEEEVRSMGLAAGGVAGMKLGKAEKIVYAGVVDGMGELLTVTANNYTKRTLLSEYSSQGRNGSGIIAHKTDKRTGSLIDALVINPERRDIVVFVTDKGIAKPVDLGEIPLSGRSTLGQALKAIARGDQVVAVKVVEAIPGFVGDETLAPPFTRGNGKAPKLETQIVKDEPPASSPAVQEPKKRRTTPKSAPITPSPAGDEPKKKRTAPTARPKVNRSTAPKATVPMKKVGAMETPTNGRKTNVDEAALAPKPATRRKAAAKPAHDPKPTSQPKTDVTTSDPKPKRRKAAAKSAPDPQPVMKSQPEEKVASNSKPATRHRKAADNGAPASPVQQPQAAEEGTVKPKPATRRRKAVDPEVAAVEAQPIQPELLSVEVTEATKDVTQKASSKSRQSKGTRSRNTKSKVERVSSVTKSQKKK